MKTYWLARQDNTSSDCKNDCSEIQEADVLNINVNWIRLHWQQRLMPDYLRVSVPISVGRSKRQQIEQSIMWSWEMFRRLATAEYGSGGTEVFLKASNFRGSMWADIGHDCVPLTSRADEPFGKGNARLPHADRRLWIYNCQSALNSCNVCAAFTVWFTGCPGRDKRNPLIFEARPRWFRVAGRDRMIHWWF